MRTAGSRVALRVVDWKEIEAWKDCVSLYRAWSGLKAQADSFWAASPSVLAVELMLADPSRVATGEEGRSSLLPSFCRDDAATVMQLATAGKPQTVFTVCSATSTINSKTTCVFSLPIHLDVTKNGGGRSESSTEMRVGNEEGPVDGRPLLE